jgi:MFS family permease
MTLVRLASLIGVALLVMVVNVVMSILYMVVYGYLINPGHPKEYYDEHIKVAAPYCSIVAGIPLMFLAGLWVAGWWAGQIGVKAALVVWLAYAIIDLGIVLAAGAKEGLTAKMWVLVAVSLLTKLAAAYAGALVAVHNASQNASAGPG